ncbi:hypothetical protein Fmac_031972 [Flemingia macrophylla]|uniref:peptidylprolyl isomerase n=1 Tax=Flemingia macrophylla TaxID=520843 RepID=A0ABD1L3K9_9FABA
MAKKKNPTVFMDVSIDGDPVERMVFELFYDVAPKTAENFRALCTGERGVGPNTGKSLHYRGSFFHQIVKGSIARGGDFVKQNGTGGESIYGSKFPEESPRLKHDAPGFLSMAVADRDTLGSHFIITFKADHHLDRKHVVFGKLVLGHDVLKKIEDVGDEEGLPSGTVKIINCGEHNADGKKINKSKMGRDGSLETNSHEVMHKGRNKQFSRDRRKRRKNYSSESDSSSDSDMKSSESDSDSESDVSSSSYTSSSSDDRRRGRKRYRKDKHRRGKRIDKHRDKRRRKQEKRSKHRSRREIACNSDSDSDSMSDNSSDGRSCGAQPKNEKRKDHSRSHAHSLVVEKELPPMHLKKREKLDMLEEEEFPKENGQRHRNGTGTNYRSDKREGRQPDVMDDKLGKSRSQSMSPKQIMRNSMSISPMNGNQSPSISPKSRLSRSPSGCRSPYPPLQRSLSRSPIRSISRTPNIRSISRSPVRGKKGRNVSACPVRTHNHRTVSRSPVRSHNHRSVSGNPVRTRNHRSVGRSPGRTHKHRSARRSPMRTLDHRSVSRSPVRSRGHRSVSASPVRSLSRRSSPRALSQRSISRSPVRTSVSRSPVRSHGHRSFGASHVRSLSRSYWRSSPQAPSRRSISRSPVRASRKSISRSPVRSSARSLSRSSGRVPVRSISRSPVKVSRRGNHCCYSRSRNPVCRTRTPRGRSLSRSVSPDASPKRVRTGRGFSERYSYARRYRTPSRSPVRSYRYNGRFDRDRFRSRSRTPSISSSPQYRAQRYSLSPVRSRSPVDMYRPRVERSRTLSRSRNPSRSVESQSPRNASRSRSSSGSPDGKKGLVSYGGASPDSSQR